MTGVMPAAQAANAIAAVSIRKTRVPSVVTFQQLVRANSISGSVKPPSGPTARATSLAENGKSFSPFVGLICSITEQCATIFRSGSPGRRQ
jgi:hypothetical protein